MERIDGRAANASWNHFLKGRNAMTKTMIGREALTSPIGIAIHS